MTAPTETIDLVQDEPVLTETVVLAQEPTVRSPEPSDHYHRCRIRLKDTVIDPIAASIRICQDTSCAGLVLRRRYDPTSHDFTVSNVSRQSFTYLQNHPDVEIIESDI